MKKKKMKDEEERKGEKKSLFLLREVSDADGKDNNSV